MSDLQFGFRENRNTTLAIFHLVSDLLDAFHRKLYTIALFLDLSRAFDTINKEILLFKLSCYGIRGSPLSFLESYLTGRSQHVGVNGFTSDSNNVNIGVPQGSVLGPLLFNLFINDVINAFPCKKVFYADDGVLYVTASSLDDCVDLLKDVIKNLSTWLSKNKLIPNTDKTKLMLFTPRPVNVYPNVVFNGSTLEWVDSIKYLGVILDKNLNFVQHSTIVKQKLSKINGTMYAISHLLPQKTLIQIYNCLAYSTVSQNVIIWGGVSKVHRDAIQVMLNKILRKILHVKFNHNGIPLVSVNSMFKQLNLLKFCDILKLFLLKFIHYMFYVNPDIFVSHFLSLLPSHHYATRNSRINLPETRLDIEKSFTIFQVCKLYNKIDASFLEPQSKHTLNKNFKKFCINKY